MRFTRLLLLIFCLLILATGAHGKHNTVLSQINADLKRDINDIFFDAKSVSININNFIQSIDHEHPFLVVFYSQNDPDSKWAAIICKAIRTKSPTLNQYMFNIDTIHRDKDIIHSILSKQFKITQTPTIIIVNTVAKEFLLVCKATCEAKDIELLYNRILLEKILP